MIGHDRKRDAVDRKHGCQMLKPIPSPLSAVFKIPSRDNVLATKKRPSHTAIEDVNHLNFVGVN
jgi:hypothetical protein